MTRSPPQTGEEREAVDYWPLTSSCETFIELFCGRARRMQAIYFCHDTAYSKLHMPHHKRRNSGTSRHTPRKRGAAGERQLVARRCSVRLKRKRVGLRFFRADRDALAGCAVLLLPRLDGVSSGRQIIQREFAVLLGDGVVGIFEDEDIALHPRMHVALHGNGEFSAREAVINRRS